MVSQLLKVISLAIPAIVTLGGPFWTVPELCFEKKELIPALQQLLSLTQALWYNFITSSGVRQE